MSTRDMVIKPYGLHKIAYIYFGQALALFVGVVIGLGILHSLDWHLTTRDLRLVAAAVLIEFSITFFRWWKRRIRWVERERELLARIEELEARVGA